MANHESRQMTYNFGFGLHTNANENEWIIDRKRKIDKFYQNMKEISRKCWGGMDEWMKRKIK